MANSDKMAGPLQGQVVLTQVATVIRPGIIYLVNADGTCNITRFVTGTAVVDLTNAGNVPGLTGAAGTDNKWAYMPFF